MNLQKDTIKILHITEFTIFIFPKLRLFKAQFLKDEKQFNCELDDKLIFTNCIYFIDFKNKRFNKLNFKKYPIERRKNNIKYPSVFSSFTEPKLGIPINIYSKPIAIQNKPTQINNIKPTKIIQNPIDLSISKNITVCQIHLNQQIQSCQVLNQ